MDKNAKRNSGGLLIFIRRNFRSFASVAQHTNEDILWLKIDKHLTNYDLDVYLCCTYLSPRSACRVRGDDQTKLNVIYDGFFV